jgi:hypothetical protein
VCYSLQVYSCLQRCPDTTFTLFERHLSLSSLDPSLHISITYLPPGFHVTRDSGRDCENFEQKASRCIAQVFSLSPFFSAFLTLRSDMHPRATGDRWTDHSAVLVQISPLFCLLAPLLLFVSLPEFVYCVSLSVGRRSNSLTACSPKAASFSARLFAEAMVQNSFLQSSSFH